RSQAARSRSRSRQAGVLLRCPAFEMKLRTGSRATDAPREEDPLAPLDPTPVEPPPRRRRPHSLLVEFVRLIMVSIFAVAGWEVAASLGPRASTRLLV